jgi:hypothetical protein
LILIDNRILLLVEPRPHHKAFSGQWEMPEWRESPDPRALTVPDADWRPSWRAQAKQSIGPFKERMDCFVALLLAMTTLT